MSESTTKFSLKQTALIGLAFFTTSIAWSMFNTQVNITLFQYLGSYALVGAWMAMDNIIGVILQPIMGTFSDNTRTKLGRRMPYLLIGIPLSAIFFIMISTINPANDPLWLLLLWMFFFNISMASYRSQAVALMPDFVQPVNRSKGNAVINFMGGIGALVAYIFNKFLVPISLFLAFVAVAIIMVIALVVLLLTIKEKESFSYQLILEVEGREGEKVGDSKDKPNLIESIKDILSEDDKSTLFMLLAIFSWFVGYQALEALFTVYGMDVLGLSRGDAGFMLLYVALAFLASALPAGILGSKIGRRLTIKIGLILFIAALIIGFAIQTEMVITIILIVAGIGWGFININSIVIVWEMAPTSKKIGTYTGVYYFFSFMAAILGPFMVGLRRGEAELTEEEERAKKEAIQEL
ncbi:MAG: MFS transporter [Promethearchaeota archaeon]|jgi:Na+/melibiose symporter-like transporter